MSLHYVNGKPRWSQGQPLTCSMDNVLASKLGTVAYQIKRTESLGGDSIDAGLLLRKLIEEAGFQITEIQ